MQSVFNCSLEDDMSHFRVSSVQICCSEVFTVRRRLKVKFDKTSRFVYFSSLHLSKQNQLLETPKCNFVQTKRARARVPRDVWSSGRIACPICSFIYILRHGCCLNTATCGVLCFCFISVASCVIPMTRGYLTNLTESAVAEPLYDNTCTHSK